MMTQTERDRVVSEYVKTPDGRKALAAAMAQPLRGRIFDYVPCPVCGESVRSDCIAQHASGFDDDGHRVLEVMES